MTKVRAQNEANAVLRTFIEKVKDVQTLDELLNLKAEFEPMYEHLVGIAIGLGAKSSTRDRGKVLC